MLRKSGLASQSVPGRASLAEESSLSPAELGKHPVQPMVQSALLVAPVSTRGVRRCIRVPIALMNSTRLEHSLLEPTDNVMEWFVWLGVCIGSHRNSCRSSAKVVIRRLDDARKYGDPRELIDHATFPLVSRFSGKFLCLSAKRRKVGEFRPLRRGHTVLLSQ